MNAEDWIVLRTAGSKTLKLADSLHAAGYDVWTPRETLNKRVPRRRARRSDVIPVMPSYVFARARHLLDLICESETPASQHPDFSVFQHNLRYPLIAEEALAPLRSFERKRIPVQQMPRFSRGEMVKLTEGGFAGLTGVVELTKGQFTMVTFPGFPMPIKISSLLLLAETPQPMARAA